MEYQGEYEALRIAQLTARQLEGKLSNEESVLLDQLLAKSPEYRKAYQTLLNEHGSPLTVDDSAMNAMEALQRVLQRHKESKIRKRRFIGYAAAVIMVLLTVGLGTNMLLRRNSHTVELNAKHGNDVSPGGNRAILMFSDGRKLQLSEEKAGITNRKGQIAYVDGETIIDAHQSKTITLSTPNAGQYQVSLPDGTTVWLNAASSLSYPITFIEKERRVKLTGEGFFKVAHNAQKPFIVETKGQSVQVLGTEFNLNSYPNEPVTTTTLVKGSIRIANNETERSVLLRPGEQALLSEKDLLVNTVAVGDYTAWKDGFIILNGADLDQVIRKIERWYDVEFDKPVVADSVALAGVIPRDIRLSEVLSALEVNTGIRFAIEGRRVRILQ